MPGYGEDDGGLDMGHSTITETVGWGGFVLGGAPGILNLVGERHPPGRRTGHCGRAAPEHREGLHVPGPPDPGRTPSYPHSRQRAPVGNLLIQQEEAENIVPMQPFDICVGMTQSQIGTMLQQALTNALREAGIQLDVVTVISHFLVSADDPDFQILSKPVGPFLRSELKERFEQRGHTIREMRKGHERPY